jgi:hypothetical protein
MFVGVGLLCFIAAAVAVASLHAYNGQSVLMLRPTESQALNELSKSARMLASADPAKAPKMESAAVLKKAAEMLEKAQRDKIAKAAQELEKEEDQEAEVKRAAGKLLKQARTAQKKEESADVVAREKAAVDAQFDDVKKGILARAQKEIKSAEAQKSKVEKTLTKKVKIGQKLGANDDLFLDLNPPLEPPEHYDPFTNMDPPIIKKSGRVVLKGTAHEHDEKSGATEEKAKAADTQVEDLERELKEAKAKAADAEKVMMQHLEDVSDDEDDEDDPAYEAGKEGEDWKPTYYEDYYPGKLGPMAESKLVREDRPKGHKKCRFHDIDCDEMYPWGKKKIVKDQVPERYGKLGDNMVGVFGQDDVVVPLAKSGLIAKAKPYSDQFDHWPEDSKKNKDLLYGNARKVISQEYTGVGDVYVPLHRLETMESHRHTHGQPLADLLFGSWQQGFVKPHDHQVRKGINMFDQPYRQHYASMTGKGHQIFKLENRHDISEQYGGLMSEGRTKGDDKGEWKGSGAKEEEEEGDSYSFAPNAFYP